MNIELDGLGIILLFPFLMAIGCISALILEFLFRKASNMVRFGATVLIVFLSSTIMIAWLNYNGHVSGSYMLPDGFNASSMTNEELGQAVFNYNSEVRGMAYVEIEKRGSATSNILINII